MKYLIYFILQIRVCAGKDESFHELGVTVAGSDVDSGLSSLMKIYKHKLEFPSNKHKLEFPSNKHKLEFPSNKHELEFPSSKHELEFPSNQHELVYPCRLTMRLDVTPLK